MAWKVDTVQSMIDGWGFNVITDPGNQPVLLFVYMSLEEAKAAAEKVRSAIENAIAVRAC